MMLIRRKSFFIAVFLGIPLIFTSAESASRLKPQSAAHVIPVKGLQRTYRLYVPESLPRDAAVPLVIVFHGGGGNGAGVERLTRFSDLAEREHFLVAYPDGILKNWNDGREKEVSIAHRNDIDDVGFVKTMIDNIMREHRVDPNRIFVTGISNGAIFSHYLAAHLSSQIAAIAPVVGGIADPFHKKFHPDSPVSVFIIQGTRDPLTPYDGGSIAQGRRGKIIATADTVKKWIQNNGCNEKPVEGELPARDPTDGCAVSWSTWSGCREDTEVTLYTLKGAGHAWPGGARYLPERIIGKVCRDFDATEVIWDFFENHPKR